MKHRRNINFTTIVPVASAIGAAVGVYTKSFRNGLAAGISVNLLYVFFSNKQMNKRKS